MHNLRKNSSQNYAQRVFAGTQDSVEVNMLKQGATELGIELSQDALQQFQRFEALLLEANKYMNLTAITQHEEIAVKHFLDSLTLIPALGLSSGLRLIDVGAGAGFPSLPLKFVLPGLSVTLLDSVMKRVRFLQDTVNELCLTQIQCEHGRAENFARLPKYREQFDIAVARAVAPLPVLCELCLPFVRVGGVFAAMKGPGAADEARAAENALKELGGEILEIKNQPVPLSELSHTIIIIRKYRGTMSKYPRKAGVPSKKPL